MAGEEQAMTSERLEWITQRWTWRSSVNLPSTSEAAHHVHELLAEVKRQRGVLEALARAIRFERELKQQEGERHGAD